MDNENKELELESRDVGVTAGAEFDPTESDEFYSNLEAAIGFEEEPEINELPELLLSDDLFGEAEVQEYRNGEQTTAEEDLFAGVDAALAEQIENEFGGRTEISSTEERKTVAPLTGWRAVPAWTKILVGVIMAVLVSVGLLFGTPGGRKLVLKVAVGTIFDWLKKDDDDPGYISPTPDLTVTVTPGTTGDPNVTPDPTGDPAQNPDATPQPTENPDATVVPTATPTPAIQIMDDENIINVLLLGEENMTGANRGRTDAIIVVSVNLNGGPLKMISFQRDLYVSIPGNADDKLNAAYTYGGARLIVETLENNFGIDIDSYVKVGFDGFENIIDQLGGLRLSLTAKESEYLNRTRYISKPEERNTVAGYQNMTGAQVLGYCRVRYVPTAEGLRDDWGRNYRQRAVLQALFEQFKGKSFPELATIMHQCFGYVSVPSDLEDLAVDCLHAVIENRMFSIETMQMPKANMYSDATIGGKDVIVMDLDNIDILQDFLYGEN